MEGSGRASWGRQVSRRCRGLAALNHRLRNFRCLFPAPWGLWSERDLTASATLAFWGRFLGQSVSSATGWVPWGVFPGFPLLWASPSRMNGHLPPAPGTAPCSSAGGRGRSVHGKARQPDSRDLRCSHAPRLGALKGFRRISGVERKFFLIVSSLFLAGSVHFSRRQWPGLDGNQTIRYLREIKCNRFRISIHLLSVVQ